MIPLWTEEFGTNFQPEHRFGPRLRSLKETVVGSVETEVRIHKLQGRYSTSEAIRKAVDALREMPSIGPPTPEEWDAIIEFEKSLRDGPISRRHGVRTLEEWFALLDTGAVTIVTLEE